MQTKTKLSIWMFIALMMIGAVYLYERPPHPSVSTSAMTSMLENEAERLSSSKAIPQPALHTPDVADTELRSHQPSWMKSPPEFKVFNQFHEKAVKTQEEIEAFKENINSFDMILAAQNHLLKAYTSGQAYDMQEERARINATIYLTSLINSQYPSIQQDAAIELAEQVIAKPIDVQIIDPELRKSLVRDKVDLGIEIYMHHHLKWQKFEQTYSGESYEKLFDFIAKEVLLRKNLYSQNVAVITERLKRHDAQSKG